MKKYILLSLISLLSFSSVFAAVEDDSIIKELEKETVKALEFDFKMKKFESCENLEDVMGNYVKEYWKSNKQRFNYPVLYRSLWGPEMMVDDVMEESAVQADSDSSAKSVWGGSDDFSETNIQVSGVDESDVIKTDGKYVYYFNSKDRYVYIVTAGKLEIVKKIKLPKTFNNPVLYIAKNRLVILSTGYSNTDYSKRGYWVDRATKSYTIVFDTTDITAPKLTKLYIADGDVRKSRKIGDYLYIISNNRFDIPYYTFKNEEDIDIDIDNILPKRIDITKTSKTSEQNLKIKNKKLPYKVTAGNAANCSDIEYALPDAETLKQFDFSPSYNIISILNINDISEEVKTKVIAGDSSEIYMSLDSLYLTSNIYQTNQFSCPAWAYCILPWYPRGQNTLVHKINIDGNDLSYQDSTIVPWAPLTQYSMDEHKENFRIITKTNNWWREESDRHTDLYILDKDLKLKGSLNNLWTGEEFKSSRFIGDKLFLVTFKQVDPLFAIDVSDAENPTILGELKIPGYSTYLHPYDDNHLIGIGYDTAENKFGGTYNNGLKVDLYQINYDKKCGDTDLDEDEKAKCESWDYKWIIVKQLHTLTLGEYGSDSPALRNPRAFVWNKAKNILLIPATTYINDKENYYTHKDFAQWLFGITINKDTGIEKKYAVSHIDRAGLEEKRNKDCAQYTAPVK